MRAHADFIRLAPRMSFSEIGIAPAIVQVLKEQGITESFEVQAEVIPAMMQGKDVCCRAPTGSGKTLAFGLPLISRIEKSKGICIKPNENVKKFACGGLLATEINILLVFVLL
mgnify:CR=1 FL=1